MEQENLMFSIMGLISQTDAPITFKGAMITRLILAENNFDRISRTTKDVDANWTDKPPTMQHLVSTLNQSLKDMQNMLEAVPTRDYTSTQSAGISIVEKSTGNELFSMDISVKPVQGNRIYYYGDIGIKGVLPDEVLSDKLAVISSPRLFRRIKDMVDIYALSHCIDVSTDKIISITEAKQHDIQDFDCLLNRASDVKHAYEKLRGIHNKPDFDKVYSYIISFVKPFVEKDRSSKVWNSQSIEWN